MSYIFFNRAVSNRMDELVNVLEDNEKDVNDNSPIPKTDVEYNEFTNSRFAPQPSNQFEAPSESFLPTNSEISPEIAELLGVNSQINTIEKDALENLIDGENEIDEKQNIDRIVRKSCSKCHKHFQLKLPDGLDSAYTNCPFCNSEEFISL